MFVQTLSMTLECIMWWVVTLCVFIVIELLNFQKTCQVYILCSLVKLHCNFCNVYVLYIGIDNSSQGPTLMQ